MCPHRPLPAFTGPGDQGAPQLRRAAALVLGALLLVGAGALAAGAARLLAGLGPAAGLPLLLAGAVAAERASRAGAPARSGGDLPGSP